MTRRKKWLLWTAALLLPLVAVIGFVLIGVFNVFQAHLHCMKATGLALKTYALDHEGKFPLDTNGFGNALLLLVKGQYSSIGEITGPGDDGTVFRNALETGERIPEEKCSRVYIQGLSESNNPQIAIVFDKKPCRGGDHFRRPWGPLVREVCLLDGSMHVIPETGWKEFSSNQVELLVLDGLDRAAARHYYEIP